MIETSGHTGCGCLLHCFHSTGIPAFAVSAVIPLPYMVNLRPERSYLFGVKGDRADGYPDPQDVSNIRRVWLCERKSRLDIYIPVEWRYCVYFSSFQWSCSKSYLSAIYSGYLTYASLHIPSSHRMSRIFDNPQPAGHPLTWIECSLPPNGIPPCGWISKAVSVWRYQGVWGKCNKRRIEIVRIPKNNKNNWPYHSLKRAWNS